MEQLKKTLTALPIAAGLVLAVSACTDTGDDVARVPNQTQSPEPSAESAAAPSEATGQSSTGLAEFGAAGSRDAQAAVASAEAAVRGSSAIELDYSERHQSWEVDLFDVDTEHEVQVSPDGSEVLEQRESGGVEPEVAGELEQAKISMADALAIAIEAASGNVEEVSLEDEDGRPVWEVEIDHGDGSSTDVRINAMTGDRII
ncbi:PepSY domain-containing protein [Arthrobacter sp.]|uniref:PepSY domain-containing protein n=1 Tax=Arthrobacter sp. TaxID=1667 RepID=UPI003396858E